MIFDNFGISSTLVLWYLSNQRKGNHLMSSSLNVQLTDELRRYSESIIDILNED
ncbi:MAG: hypothetical protein AAGA60_31250 [Cyanobacteria bacterium P01_E01_bin.42]